MGGNKTLWCARLEIIKKFPCGVYNVLHIKCIATSQPTIPQPILSALVLLVFDTDRRQTAAFNLDTLVVIQ